MMKTILLVRVKWKSLVLFLQNKGVIWRDIRTYKKAIQCITKAYQKYGIKGVKLIRKRLSMVNNESNSSVGKGSNMMRYLDKITVSFSEYEKIRRSVSSFSRKPSVLFLILPGDAARDYETVNAIHRIIYPSEKISIVHVACSESEITKIKEEGIISSK